MTWSRVISCPVDYPKLGVGNIQQLRQKTFNQLMFPTRQRTREGFYYGQFNGHDISPELDIKQKICRQLIDCTPTDDLYHVLRYR
jgi:hypothetical protein